MKLFFSVAILSWVVFIKPVAFNQPVKLGTGLYLLVDSSPNKLTFGKETFYADPKPICTVKNFKSVSVLELPQFKVHYQLNITLDDAGAKSLEKATDISFEKINIGLVIKGELKKKGGVGAKITGGKLSLNGASKEEFEQIKHQLDAEIKP